ncbi:MAG: glycosyltransferase family 2 protein [Desulfotignum sp.]|nr:glycosyltransferase family 2 protein [Desulfotignum sp.]
MDGMMGQEIDISIVCPMYNEAAMIPPFMAMLFPVLEKLNRPFEIICVNDGSKDDTFDRLMQEKQQRGHITVINFSRNFGKEAALTAGLAHAAGRAVIPMDADLQDPPELIADMVAYWDKGYDVVLARRTDRSTDRLSKRITAKWFYRIHNLLSSILLPADVGDFRLMSRKVVDAVNQLPENQRFMKGIFAWVGFKTATVGYVRDKRKAGKTRFNFWKLWNLAIDGVTSFSSAPLRIWLYLGIFTSLLSFLYGCFIVFKTLIYGVDVPGYASIVTIILFLGGIQLIGIGVIGEYIGRMYLETKRRPPYIIEGIY